MAAERTWFGDKRVQRVTPPDIAEAQKDGTYAEKPTDGIVRSSRREEGTHGWERQRQQPVNGWPQHLLGSGPRAEEQVERDEHHEQREG